MVLTRMDSVTKNDGLTDCLTVWPTKSENLQRPSSELLPCSAGRGVQEKKIIKSVRAPSTHWAYFRSNLVLLKRDKSSSDVDLTHVTVFTPLGNLHCNTSALALGLFPVHWSRVGYLVRDETLLVTIPSNTAHHCNTSAGSHRTKVRLNSTLLCRTSRPLKIVEISWLEIGPVRVRTYYVSLIFSEVQLFDLKWN